MSPAEPPAGGREGGGPQDRPFRLFRGLPRTLNDLPRTFLSPKSEPEPARLDESAELNKRRGLSLDAGVNMMPLHQRLAELDKRRRLSLNTGAKTIQNPLETAYGDIALPEFARGEKFVEQYPSRRRSPDSTLPKPLWTNLHP